MSANGLRPYPAYKDSGVEWLGKVPEHWEVRRLGATTERLVAGTWGSDPTGLDDIVCVRVADFDRQRWGVDLREPTLRSVPLGERQGRLLAAGDLLLEKSGGGDLQPVGAVVHFDHDQEAVASNFIGRMRVRKQNSARYVLYLNSVLYALRITVRSIKQTTGIQNLDVGAYLGESVPLPPLSEQAAIARFLDAADRRIRRYIRAKERLIELLEERKRALIHEAVTGRIDVRTGQPYPAYKDSGVEWIGKVPEHWEAKRIKTLARSGYKTFVDGDWIESPYITSDGIRLIQTGNVGIGEYREQGFRYISERTFDEFGCTEFDPGDVLICRLGLPVARACLAPSLGKRMITSVDVCILRPRGGVSPAYLVYTMSSRRYLRWVASLVRGSTRDRVSRSMLGGFTVPVPPSSEQNRVADYLDEVVGALKTTIRGTEQSIKLIRQYRTRLIADVVTGKLDAREEEADLPGIDPLAGNRDRAEAIPIESNLHSTAHDMVKEAVS